MKTIPLVLMFAVFAAALTAQQPAARPKVTPSHELAKILAVEEQERDLAKAEALYREALAGKALSAEARDLATQRLAALLMSLGRREEAKQVLAAAAKVEGALVSLDDVTSGLVQGGRDVEREKALREKARGLVAQVIADAGAKGNQDGSVLSGIAGPVAEQLLWIGEPAIPEVIAALEGIAKADNYTPAVVRSLAAFLWRVGGGKAAAFLRQALDDQRMAGLYADAACSATQPDMMVVAELYLRSPIAGLSESMLDDSRWGKKLRYRLQPELLIDVLGRGSIAQRSWLLTWALNPKDRQNETLEGEAIAKLIPVVRAALDSTEPQLGALAQKLLAEASYLQSSPEGLSLVIERLPSPWLSGRHLLNPSKELRPDAAQATSLLPKVDACLRAMAAVGQDDMRRSWIVVTAYRIIAPLDASVVPQVLSWVDLGWSDLLDACDGKVNDANGADVFARIDRVSVPRRRGCLEMFQKTELPRSLFPAMRAKADAWNGEGASSKAWANVMGRTGHPDAAAWILGAWQREVAGEPSSVAQVAGGKLVRTEASSARDAWAVDALVELGRRTQEEPVRAAMRTMASRLQGDGQSRLYLALLSMHDGSALTQMTNDVATHGAVVHPYAKVANRPVTPLSYVLEEQPDPPHGFSQAELLAFVRTMPTWEGRIPQDKPSRALLAKRVPTELVLVLAETSDQGWGKSGDWFTWPKVAADRLAQEPDLDGPLHRWWGERLGKPGPIAFSADALSERDVLYFHPGLEALLRGDDPDLASMAFRVLIEKELPLDLEALSQSKHAEVARLAFHKAMDRGVLSVQSALRGLTVWPDDRDSIAQYCGAKVAVEAVPALLQLLQDNEKHVRERAAEALTRIRFFHEQQAHWDRVLKGLDASPASAAEKLLLQGKPGAPKEQRLLAITSLGTLGVPEALPFLIEWTQDTDAEIAKAAKDAITQIHLNPRR